jgi:hypothetical protein
MFRYLRGLSSIHRHQRSDIVHRAGAAIAIGVPELSGAGLSRGE